MIVQKTKKWPKKSAAFGGGLLVPVLGLKYNHFLDFQNKKYRYWVYLMEHIFFDVRVCIKISILKEFCENWSKWGIPRTGYLVPGRDATRAWPNAESSWDVTAAAAAAVICSSWVGCRPPRPPLKSACRPPWFLEWFDWVTSGMAVQFNGLIEWLPGWLSSLIVWLSDFRDGCLVLFASVLHSGFLEWIVFQYIALRVLKIWLFPVSQQFQGP